MSTYSFDDLQACKLSINDCAEKYVDILERSIQSKMIDIEPDRIGFFLSGGLDSSANVALASRMRGNKFKTFGIGFPDEKFDERPYARIVAKHFGVNFYDYVFKGTEIDSLPQMIWALDEPFMENGLFFYTVTRIWPCFLI